MKSFLELPKPCFLRATFDPIRKGRKWEKGEMDVQGVHLVTSFYPQMLTFEGTSGTIDHLLYYQYQWSADGKRWTYFKPLEPKGGVE